MRRRRGAAQCLLCIRNDGYPASLLTRRLYEQLPDADADARGLVRVIDESGADYLYPQRLFVAVNLPLPVVRAMAA